MRKALWKMENERLMKDGEFLIGGNALTLITKGGNAGTCQTRDHLKKEEIAKKNPHLTSNISMYPDV